MKATLCASVLLGMLPLVARAAQPWREVTVPTVAEAAASFAEPPMEYRAVHWAIWGGRQDKERIISDLEKISASGGGVYMINNSRGLRPMYFTPEYLDVVKLVVQECKKRGMKVWIEGDAGYPDGFAGGMISRDCPQLGMQAIVADARYLVTAGQTLTTPLPVDTLGVLASPHLADTATAAEAASAMRSEAPGRRGSTSGRGGATAVPPSQGLALPTDGQFKWTAPIGGIWYVSFQGGVGEARYSVASGQTLTIPLPPGTKSIQANLRTDWRPGQPERRAGGPTTTVLPLPRDGQFTWTAPATGTWEVTFVRHVYRSSPTRFVNREDGTNEKDSLYSLIDYLDPEATRAYIGLILETYEKLLGDEFGKTILGFRGDEPDFTGFMPWTPKLPEAFQEQKDYDLKPYIAHFFASELSPAALRAKADYWDVWSGMFRDSFYQPLQDWCEARNMEYMVHLNHEEVMIDRNRGEDLIRNEGSLFRCFRYVGVPGIDNLNHIRPGQVSDFPKLASSAAHLFGRPLIWTEQGDRGGKYVVDHQLVRGINHMNVSGLASQRSRGSGAPSADQPAPNFGWYVSRAQHLMALGRPAAQVALYHPTDSM